MLISEVRKEQGQEGRPQPSNSPSGETWGRRRHPVVARFKAALGIMWHAARHPLTAGIINLDTGEVRPYRD
jgi:hypothetical protein